jgi:hypothetical protein
LHLIEQTDLLCWYCCIELHHGAILLSQPYGSLGTQDDSIILP